MRREFDNTEDGYCCKEAIDPTPIAEIVLPGLQADNVERHLVYFEDVDEYRKVVTERDFEAIALQLTEALSKLSVMKQEARQLNEAHKHSEERLAEVIAQRDEARKVIAHQRRERETIVSGYSKTRKLAEKAEAALATERARALQEVMAAVDGEKLMIHSAALDGAKNLNIPESDIAYSKAIRDVEDAIAALAQK